MVPSCYRSAYISPRLSLARPSTFRKIREEVMHITELGCFLPIIRIYLLRLVILAFRYRLIDNDGMGAPTASPCNVPRLQ